MNLIGVYFRIFIIKLHLSLSFSAHHTVLFKYYQLILFISTKQNCSKYLVFELKNFSLGKNLIKTKFIFYTNTLLQRKRSTGFLSSPVIGDFHVKFIIPFHFRPAHSNHRSKLTYLSVLLLFVILLFVCSVLSQCKSASPKRFTRAISQSNSVVVNRLLRHNTNKRHNYFLRV